VQKTKYLIISRREDLQDPLVVWDSTSERVLNFKYQGVDINQQANSHKDIKIVVIAQNNGTKKKCTLHL